MGLGRMIAAAAAVVSLAAQCVLAAEPVTVSIDRSKPAYTSQITLGITHTHMSLDRIGKNAKGAEPAAVERATAAITAVAGIQNTHIIGWGPMDINPEPGVYKWETLDARIALMRSMKSPMAITLCTAPGWMKRKGDTWAMEDRPSEEHFDDFAKLCVEVAKRYPDVRYYQVWNEFKGFWSSEKNNWDVESYTAMYNKVYDALKAHDSSLKIGGFYLVVPGTGSTEIGRSGTATHKPIGQKEKPLVEYWLKNKHGADFICLDRGIQSYHDKNTYTYEELAGLVHWYGDIGEQIHQMTDLPVWWSEYYIAGRGLPVEGKAAIEAAVYANMIRGYTEAALLWNPVEGEIPHALVSNITTPDGGQPLPHYRVFDIINKHFGKGTPIYRATSSSPMIEALASKDKTLLINKHDRPESVKLDAQTIELAAYEVKLVDLAAPSAK